MRASSGVEKSLPFNCIHINEFRAIHMNIYSDANKYSIECRCTRIFIRMSLDKQELFSNFIENNLT